MPAMLLMLFVTLLAARFILFAGSLGGVGWQSISTLMLSANMLIWHVTHNYWGLEASNMPLLHNWSLSLEEQFYLIYPLLILAFFKWYPRGLLSALTAIFVFSLGLCIIETIRYPSAAFYFLPTRAWELAGGCFVSVFEKQRNGHTIENVLGLGALRVSAFHSLLALLGLALIGASWFSINEIDFPGYKALVPVAGAMLVILFGGGRNCPATSFLSISALRFIGKISYSLYLWHWPVIVLGRLAQARWENVPMWFCLTLIPIVSIPAYYLVEQPGRRLSRILPPVMAAVCAVIVLSTSLIFTRPSYDLSKLAPTVWMGSVYDVSPKQATLTGILGAKFEGITRPDRNPQYANAYQEGIIKRYGGEDIDVLVLGNSHALMWAPDIDEICQESHLTVCFYAAEGVDPIPSVPAQRKAMGSFSPDQWLVFDSNRIKFLKQWRPRLVIVASRWRNFPLTDNLDRFLEVVEGQNSKLLFIDDPPELAVGYISVPEFVAETSAKTIKALTWDRRQDTSANLVSLSERFKCVNLLETADLFLTNRDRVKVLDGNSILYMDGDHLSLAGTRLAKERMRHKILDILEH